MSGFSGMRGRRVGVMVVSLVVALTTAVSTASAGRFLPFYFANPHRPVADYRDR